MYKRQIYKNDKWGNGNSIYNKKTEGLFELGSSYSEKDYNSQIATKGFGLSFDKKTLKINLFEKNIIVDNTVQNKKDIPQDLLSAIGERPELHLFKENKLGLLNKGAGVVDSLSRIKSTAKQYDFIVYFEPKLKIINKYKNKERGFLVITHYQRLLKYIKPDIVHVLIDGQIVKSGGKDLAIELEEKGYGWLEK